MKVPYRLFCGDCLEKMKKIPDNYVDMVMCDPPYGIVACKWDSIIPLEPMWEQLKRLIKPNGAIVMTASQPFTTILISSNMKWFKYCWVWEKGRATGHVHAKNKPMKCHEDVCLFSSGVTIHANQSKERITYNPQKTIGVPYRKTQKQSNSGMMNHAPSKVNKDYVGTVVENVGERYPRSIIKFNMHNVGNAHPTQKPVALMQYLIKTYTYKGETVLDFAMGSGTTGVACGNLNRKFIGIELSEEYFEIAEKRIQKAYEAPGFRIEC